MLERRDTSQLFYSVYELERREADTRDGNHRDEVLSSRL